MLPVYHPDAGPLAEGVVTVLVIPKTDAEHPDTPTPDSLFLRTVCDYLEPRRIVTSEVHVRGPEYVTVHVSVGVDVIPGRSQAPVLDRVRRTIRKFLSPLEGGFEEDGWPLKKAVDALEIAAAVSRVEGVAKVNGVRLGSEDGEEVTEPIPMEGLELPRLGVVGVDIGDPKTLTELLGLVESPPPIDTGTVVPVPVAPESC